MKPLNLNDVTQYVEQNISRFHQKRIDSLSTLKLSDVLKRKNPYLFRAKHYTAPDEIVRAIVDAHMSSREETIFGDWLEELAIQINNWVFNGRKSGIEGIDLEFDNDGKHYIVNIKSGPNWGNAGQIKKMKTDFDKARRIFKTSGGGMHIEAINGCCYGRKTKPDELNYTMLCGQAFWEFISGDTNLYTNIIEPLGHTALERNKEFVEAYGPMITRFIAEFVATFCNEKYEIQWENLVKYNSGIAEFDPFPKIIKSSSRKKK
jgi:hypothetical protein